MRHNRNIYNNRRNNWVQALVGAVVAIGTSVAGYVVSAQNAVKPQIDYIMHEYVYMQGYTFEQVKAAYHDLWQKNGKYFAQQFDYYAEMRNAALRAGTHETQNKTNQNRTISIVLVILIIVFIFLIFRNSK